MTDKLAIAAGAGFRVTYMAGEDRCTIEGKYLGMAMIGTGAALVLESDGRRTYLAASSVVLMEQTSDAPEAPEKEPAADRSLYG